MQLSVCAAEQLIRQLSWICWQKPRFPLDLPGFPLDLPGAPAAPSAGSPPGSPKVGTPQYSPESSTESFSMREPKSPPMLSLGYPQKQLASKIGFKGEPQMGGIVRVQSKRAYDAKAFVNCHAQKKMLDKTWPLGGKKRKRT